jgi:RNA polymerase sigma factor (sigma-70 family)
MLPIPQDEAQRLCEAAAARVFKVAYRHFGIEDLQQQAWVCLLLLARRWDPALSPFPQYASSRLALRLVDFLREQSFVPRVYQAKAKRGEHAPARVTDLEGMCRTVREHVDVTTAREEPPPAWEEAEEAEALLRRLPESPRRALRLLFVQGLSGEQAARILGCTASYVSLLKQSGLDALRKAVA